MKKLFLLVALLTMNMVATKAADCQDGPYGLQINGSKVVDAPKIGDADHQGRVQYKASCVELKVGDVVKLINQSCGATWMSAIDPYGNYTNFEGGKEAGQLTCKVAGTYDFYIKMKDQDDLVYVELSKDCGGGQGGGGNTGEGNPRFMWKAELDGEWKEPDAHSTFVQGLSNISFYESAYLFLIYQVDGVPGVEYMCEAYTTDTHARFVKGGNEKWGVPAGTTNLYLYDNGDGSVEVSNQPMEGKTLWGTGQAIENTEIKGKAYKVIIDGQLRIIRGDKMFDATGRQL